MTTASGATTDVKEERVSRRLPRLRLEPTALTWVGLGVAALGFALIALAWGKVAALLQVSLQLPYIVSGSLTGLALVMVGLTTLNVAARRQDALERAQQSAQTDARLDALLEVLDRKK